MSYYIFEFFDYFTKNCTLLDCDSTCFLIKVLKQIKPIKVYNSLKEDRLQLFKEQKDKTGVYCLVNLINGHTYIGSSVNIEGRMKSYLNNSYLKSKQNSNLPISSALSKYGQEHFAVLIVEYVDIENLTIVETNYITSLLPYYNVLKQGYSSLGYKHTENTKLLLSELAKNRVHSDKTKVLISRALIGENNPFYNQNHSVEAKLRMIEANSAYPVYIYNSFRELLVIFPSVKTLAKLINSNHSTIVSFIKNVSSKEPLFRGEWYLTNLPLNLTDTPLISNWLSKESNNIILEMNNNYKIKKAVFVYNKNKEFICKFEGVTHAGKELNINHSVIKKYALLNAPYKDYIFSYERLRD
uniref:I-AbiXVI-P n=1 Tax=Agaricus bisporus var. bisporus (strain H97 / ATCC MYA-4626 / FGSC 10389) TaxID=936046 RepID=S4SQB0_AGABB|nr:I-AbiXVI-P [Agaricus bisporus var. bisporus H97]